MYNNNLLSNLFICFSILLFTTFQLMSGPIFHLTFSRAIPCRLTPTRSHFSKEYRVQVPKPTFFMAKELSQNNEKQTI